MRCTVFVPLIAAVALSACDSKDSVEAKNESVESVAKKVAATSVRPLPGRWESTMTVDRMEMKGVPAAATQGMRQNMGSHSFVTCLTPEQASKPEGDFFRPGESGCTYDSFTMDGGKVDAVMTCKQPGGQRVSKTTMSGTYGETAYEMKLSSQSEIQAGMPMSMSMTIKSHRVGDCKGDENK